jgi:hypothetical protein
MCKLKQPEEIELLSIKKWTLQRIVHEGFMKPPESLAYRPSDLDRYVLVQKPDREKDIFPPLFLHWYTRLYCWLSGRGKLDIADTRSLVRTLATSSTPPRTPSFCDLTRIYSF